MLLLLLAVIFTGGQSSLANQVRAEVTPVALGSPDDFDDPAHVAAVQKVDAAQKMARDGRAAEAIAALDSLIAESPDVGDLALFNKGLILFSKMQKDEDAIAAFLKLTRLYPRSHLGDDAMYYAGFLAQTHLKDDARAIQLYRQGYNDYPAGDFRTAIADKLRELTGEAPNSQTPASGLGDAEHVSRSRVPGPRNPGQPRDERSRSPREASGFPLADTASLRSRGAGTVTMQFDKAPLRTFIQWVSQVTGRNFIVDDDVTGDITVFSGRQVPIAEIYPVFLSILDVKGFAAVEAGNVTKIVTRATATQSELPILIDDEATVSGDRIVTRIIHLRTLAAGAVQGLLRPFLSGTDQIVVNAETNNLILTGPAANIARIAELVRILDTERGPTMVRSYSLKHAKALVIADKLTGLISGLAVTGAPAIPFKVIADERTNSIYVLADNALHQQIRGFLFELDVDRMEGRIVKIFPLMYAKADDVVRQLRLLLGLDAAEAAPDIGGILQTILIGDPRLNSVSLATFSPKVADLVDSYVKTIDKPPGETLRTMRIIRLQYANAKILAEMLMKIFATTPGAPGATGGDAPSPGLADKVMISADERTNSLLVTATSVDWPKLQDVIRGLDVRKSQVIIDAVVLEANLSEARSLGASLSTTDPPLAGHTRILARSDPVGFIPSAASLAATSVSPGGLTIGAVRGSVVGFMLNALLASSKTNVLQMPQILALDNEVATLKVGNLTPIVTSRSVGGDNVQIGGTSAIFQNVEYRNIGLNLKLTPHIGNSGDILIESRLEIQNRNTDAEGGLNLPVFTSREIEQKFQIANGEYIILGGLLRTQDDFAKKETPWLAKIPILGVLFRNTRTSESKTVLLIFLRPRIVTDPAQARDITEENRLKYEEESKTTPGAERPETEKWIPH